MVDDKCPLCGKSAEKRTRFVEVFFCGRNGRFEWIDRAYLSSTNLIEIYQSYPYNAQVNEDFPKMKPRYMRGLRERILRHFPSCYGLSFLDVGCANGEYLECARDLGLAIVAGVEVDETAATKARKYGPIFKSLDQVSVPFDVVQCKNVLSNIENFREFFAHLLRLVKPNGVLFLDVLNQFSLSAKVKKLLGQPGALRPPFVINGFSKKAIKFLAKSYGGKVAVLQTTYCGSNLLPYRRTFFLSLSGISALLIGAGTMIIADIKPGHM